jgi:hypothetical protein
MQKRDSHFLKPPIGLLLSVGLVTLAPLAVANNSLPALMQVPADNAIAWNAHANGHITYVCQTIRTDGAKLAWIIKSASATLGNSSERLSGTYTSPPETWKSADGSALTGMEIVRAHAGADRLYDQLVLANPSVGVGVLTGVTYIQRLVSAGGAPPQTPCANSNVGEQVKVAYQANYVFWKPN